MLIDIPSTLPRGVEAVVIGGSLGAVDALGTLLPRVQAETRAAVIAVVHLPSARPSLLPSLFRPRVLVPVEEVFDKEPVVPGRIWFAPPDYHLSIERDRCFSLSMEPKVRFSRPSIDVLFESAADVYGSRLVAVVLTGANEDGAAGARAVRDAGGFVMVQSPSDAAADRMPLAAVERAAPQVVAPLGRIADALELITGEVT